MTKRAILLLADGSMYEGLSFGADTDAFGEVVFNTSMTGYQEMLTDPSYAGQIVVPTYPLIGNYGINDCDMETIGEYLFKSGIPGISGLDTRCITRKLRNYGVMMGVLTSTRTPQEALEMLQAAPDYGKTDFVKEVSTREPFRFQPETGEGSRNVVVVDYGCKYNIMRILRNAGCNVTVVPCTATAKEILAFNPDGVILSPGPGNPELLDYAVYNIRGLIGYKPIMGICLGNQLIARAFGGKNFKLKFGHRGGNHPVKDLKTGRVYITAQNHGYAVDPDSIKDGLEVSHINLNDGTVEGLRHKDLPIFTIQYHSEASPGPLDNIYLFDRFLETMGTGKSARP